MFMSMFILHLHVHVQAACPYPKPQLAGTQRCFCNGNGGMLESAFLLILVRICSRDPESHILVGAGGVPFALQQIPHNSGNDIFLGGDGLFLWFWVSAFNSL
jgi:hypothetical protein